MKLIDMNIEHINKIRVMNENKIYFELKDKLICLYGYFLENKKTAVSDDILVQFNLGKKYISIFRFMPWLPSRLEKELGVRFDISDKNITAYIPNNV